MQSSRQFWLRQSAFCYCFSFILSTFLSLAISTAGYAADVAATRCVLVQFYIDGSNETEQKIASQLQEFANKTTGINFRILDTQDQSHRQRCIRICEYFKVKQQTPLLYCCGKHAIELTKLSEWQSALEEVRSIEVFVRAGCPRCASAKEYLTKFSRNYPGFKVVLRDVSTDAKANQDVQALAKKHRIAAVSVPVFHLCNQVVVGFVDANTTGTRLEQLLKPWIIDCEKELPPKVKTGSIAPWPALMMFCQVASDVNANEQPTAEQEKQGSTVDQLPLPDELPLPTEETAPKNNQEEIDVPLLGKLNPQKLGLPLFTIAMGLVDGFNPCAMWLLVFLLSVLVNLHSRWKIIAVAGTFVAVSGVVYFAFMAAWFSVFQFIGMLRAVQITLALLAIVIGTIHVKDFFAFKKGISLSIPESAKPGIYQRVRGIITAETLWGAIAGAVVLAILVNMIELLCTAGLPALYTQVLATRQLSLVENYAYLLLYILCYMFDDSLMVALVVITLDRRKMQENHGRLLKLISGMAILILGFIMLLQPEWLGM